MRLEVDLLSGAPALGHVGLNVQFSQVTPVTHWSHTL